VRRGNVRDDLFRAFSAWIFFGGIDPGAFAPGYYISRLQREHACYLRMVLTSPNTETIKAPSALTP
jgi:hypothetical protein